MMKAVLPRSEAGKFFALQFPASLPGRSSGRKSIHLDAGFGAQAEDGGEGVFLRAADNEPGDDVGDFQIVERLNS